MKMRRMDADGYPIVKANSNLMFNLAPSDA